MTSKTIANWIWCVFGLCVTSKIMAKQVVRDIKDYKLHTRARTHKTSTTLISLSLQNFVSCARCIGKLSWKIEYHNIKQKQKQNQNKTKQKQKQNKNKTKTKTKNKNKNKTKTKTKTKKQKQKQKQKRKQTKQKTKNVKIKTKKKNKIKNKN